MILAKRWFYTKKIRRRQVQGNLDTFENGGMFVIGDNGEHEGPHTQQIIYEQNEAPLPTRRMVQWEDAIAHWVKEVP